MVMIQPTTDARACVAAARAFAERADRTLRTPDVLRDSARR